MLLTNCCKAFLSRYPWYLPRTKNYTIVRITIAFTPPLKRKIAIKENRFYCYTTNGSQQIYNHLSSKYTTTTTTRNNIMCLERRITLRLSLLPPCAVLALTCYTEWFYHNIYHRHPNINKNLKFYKNFNLPY